MPKISVIMSVYNGEKYLHQAVDSILNQIFKDFEFIIINDGSTDKTTEILKSYHDLRIKIIDNEKNSGLTKSLNKGLKMAKGEYIARMDADDVSMPDRLKRQIEFLEAHMDYAVVGTFVKILDKDSNVIRGLERPIEHAQIQEFFRRDNCIVHGSAMIRKNCLLDVGFYDESMVRAQDYELWLRLSMKYRLANLPDYLYMWRNHNENIEAKNIKEQKIFVVLAMIKNNILDIEQATKHFINIIIKNNIVPKYKTLNVVFRFAMKLTLNRIELFTLYEMLYRIRFSRKVNKILRDFKTRRIGFEKAKLSLNKVVIW